MTMRSFVLIAVLASALLGSHVHCYLYGTIINDRKCISIQSSRIMMARNSYDGGSKKKGPKKKPNGPKSTSQPGQRAAPASQNRQSEATQSLAMVDASDASNQQPNKPAKSAKNFALKTVWGQNIINVRRFSVEAQKSFEFIGSFRDNSEVPIYPIPEVAFIGRSNVGKSSMLNHLTGLSKPIAVVGKTPGRTQAINLFKCSVKQAGIADVPVCMFVDLPGYGYAKLSKTLQAEIGGFIEAYLGNRGALRAVVLLVDSRRYDPPMIQDKQMMEVLDDIGIPYIVAATKVDEMKPNEAEKAIVALRKFYNLGPSQPIAFSSVKNIGRKEIWKAIRDGIVGDGGEEREEEEEEEEEEKEEQEEEEYDPDAE